MSDNKPTAEATPGTAPSSSTDSGNDGAVTHHQAASSASASASASSTSTSTQSYVGNHPQQSQQQQQQQQQYYQQQQQHAGHNNYYGNNSYGNANANSGNVNTYSNNKHYNKNYSGRQNYNNSGNNGASNSQGRQQQPQQSQQQPQASQQQSQQQQGQQYRKSSYNNNNAKIHHNNAQAYNNYYNQVNPNQMYAAYGYIPNYNGYQVMPSMSPYGLPAQQYMPIPQPQQPIIQTPPPAKVKLTTKDGKPVDLEEKKKKVAAAASSASPVSSPANSIISPAVSIKSPVPASKDLSSSTTPSASGTPVTTAATTASTTTIAPSVASTATSVPAAAPAPAPTPAPVAKPTSSAAEEFMRKVRERAAAVQKEKEAAVQKEKEAANASQQSVPVINKAASEEKPQEKEVVEPKVEEPVVEIPAVAEPVVEAPATQEPAKKEEEAVVEAVPEPANEEKEVSQPAPVEDKSVEPELVEQPKVEEAQKDVEPTKEEITSPVSSTATAVDEEESQKDTEVNAEDEAHVEASADPEAEAEGEADADTEADAEAEPEAEEPSFTISNFLTRLDAAVGIEDLLSTKYPESITGIDASKQISSKKYRYDPQFLMQFRAVIQYPMDPEFNAKLEKVDIDVSNKKNSGANNNASRNKFGQPGNNAGGPNNRFPLQSRGSYNDPRQASRTGSKRRGPGGNERSKSTPKNKSKRRERERNDENEEPPKPVEEVKPLEKSANRWVPRSRANKAEVQVAEDGTEILPSEEIERKTKSLLNKLTLEMFEPITNDVLKLADQAKWEKNAKTVKEIISLTFAKACDEPFWSEMYAKFCAKLCTNIPNEVSDETETLKDGTHPAGGALARRLLLATCQAEYEKGWTDKLPTNEDGTPLEPEMMSDEYYAMAAAKRRGLGLVKFIGHLYNLNMLNDQVIFVCLRDQSKNVIDPSEDSLENLVQLVKTVGPKLDADDRTKTILKFVFENIDKILVNVKLSSRIKFMLMDLQDLRKSRWISISDKDAGPKTIEEIHRDAEIKRMEEIRASNEKKQRRHNEGRSNSSRAGSGWNNNNNNNSNNSNSHNNNNSSSTNLSATSNSALLNNIRKSPSFISQRSPSNGPNSSNSSADIQRETSKRSESTHINRFAALGGGDDDDDTNENEAGDDNEN